MHSFIAFHLVVVVAGFLLVGCGKSKSQASVTAKPEAVRSTVPKPTAVPSRPPQPQVPTVLAPPKPSPVRVMISANSSVHPVVSQGWPIVIEGMLILEQKVTASLKLNNAAGPWSDALTLECKGADGSDRSALFKPAYASQKSIELTRERSGLMVWVLDSVEFSTMPEGAYKIRVIIDEKKLGGAVSAGLTSTPIVVTVAASAATSTAGAVQRKCLASMSASAWKNDYAKALATATEYLTAHPKDVAVLFNQGKVQQSQGKKSEALASYEAALTAAEERKRPMGENFAIQEVISDLQRELAAK